ncbi:MarR family transcriptional regulator [Pseudohalocynthiibacter aestuariivivens]|nr:MarR family transcriptional regulator [Pseudohalocynthiibacter aestuariivivens]QIE45294.1 MarR family transcriptional regulator [Pseudohalocynthiibacter aestuariivivens]
MTKDMQQTRIEFIEKIGLIAQGDGLPRIAGRVLGLLVWGGDAVAFGDIASQLQVSRGSVSTATRILEDRCLVRRVTKPGQRQDFFQLSDNPYASMMEGVATGLARAQHEIDNTLADIPDEATDVKARVAAYANFYQSLNKAVRGIIDDIG